MKKLNPPFKFNLSKQITKARQHLNDRVTGVTINLPFISFPISPQDTEQKIAKEIVIRLADRRVLNAFECCDECIEQALNSLQEIRRFLVDKQVELMNLSDGGLYLLIEFQIEGIRQFLTFEENLNSVQDRDEYLAALEMLRQHLFRCLVQISKIADIDIPKIAPNMRYDEVWQPEAYVQIEASGEK